MDLNDEVLIQKFKTGDVESFGKIVDKYRNLAYAIAYSYLLNREDARDAAQDSFIEAYKSIKGLEKNSSLRPWLTKIVKRRSWRLARERRKQGELYYIMLDLYARSATQVSSSSCIALEEVWLSLSEIECTVLKSNLIYGYSYSEIGSQIGRSEGAVKSLAQRARQKLQKEVIQMLGQNKEYDIEFTPKTINHLLQELAKAENPGSPAELERIARESDATDLSAVAGSLSEMIQRVGSLERSLLITRAIPSGANALLHIAAQVKQRHKMLEIIPQLLDEGLTHKISPISNSQLGDYCSAVACLLTSGVPFPQAMDMSAKRSVETADVMSDVAQHLLKGEHIADAMLTHTDVFTQSFISILKFAEESAVLETIFAILAVLLWYPNQLDTSRQKGNWAERLKFAETLEDEHKPS
ncbi:MAG: sigma-70 family RNA polymerase sigma factor [Armatimonadota bacterium]